MIERRLRGSTGPPAMREVHVSKRFDAPPQRVFAALAEHEVFLASRTLRCRLLRDGGSTRNGVGAVREVRGDGLLFVEEITAFDPPRRFDYVIRSLATEAGRTLPLRHELGWMVIAADGNGSRVDWHSRFEVAIPLLGRWLAEPILAGKIAAAFNGFLDRAAQRLAAAGS
jgi:uncharacterized protein YndB with AHSA1/START domain